MKLISKLFAITCILLPCLTFADFKLSDFAGNYTSYSSSAGGSTVPNPGDAAITSIAQFKLNKNGTGIVNFASITIFFTPQVNAVLHLSNLPMEFSITNPAIGSGTLTIFDYPTVGSNLVSDFVSTKKNHQGSKNKKCHGTIEEILFNVIGFSGATPSALRNVNIIIAHRQ